MNKIKVTHLQTNDKYEDRKENKIIVTTTLQWCFLRQTATITIIVISIIMVILIAVFDDHGYKN